MSRQFNIDNNAHFLPVAHQMQVIESELVYLRETLSENNSKCKYFEDLILLNEELIGKLTEEMYVWRTVDFLAFVSGLADSQKDPLLEKHLRLLVKRIESRISVSSPLVDNPSIVIIGKGAVKKITVVYFASFLMSVCAAFLISAIRKQGFLKTSRL
jgi:hypothetical protein